jgi:hypothetical protein
MFMLCCGASLVLGSLQASWHGSRLPDVTVPSCSVLALNPGLNCAKLAPGQLVCTGTGGAPTATCGNRCADQGLRSLNSHPRTHLNVAEAAGQCDLYCQKAAADVSASGYMLVVSGCQL